MHRFRYSFHQLIYKDEVTSKIIKTNMSVFALGSPERSSFNTRSLKLFISCASPFLAEFLQKNATLSKGINIVLESRAGLTKCYGKINV